MVWKSGSKICRCFESARLAVEVAHGKEQASKFILKSNHGQKLR